jgi:hypothetical protein
MDFHLRRQVDPPAAYPGEADSRGKEKDSNPRSRIRGTRLFEGAPLDLSGTSLLAQETEHPKPFSFGSSNRSGESRVTYALARGIDGSNPSTSASESALRR